jgi:hypothetical protein
MITINFSPNRTIAQPSGYFTAQAGVVDTVVSPGSVSQSETIRDVVITGSVGVDIRKDAQIEIGVLGDENSDVAGVFPSFEMLTPEKGIVDQNGFITSLHTGAPEGKNIRVKVQSKVYSRIVSHAGFKSNGQTFTSIEQYLEDTLGQHIQTQFEGLRVTQPQLNLYSAVATRNGNVWTNQLDLSGIMFSNSQLGNRRCATAITPRHVMMAKHYQINNGATVQFVTADNEIIERTITSKRNVNTTDLSKPRGSGLDLTVGLLNSPLPESIATYKTLPANWQDYLTLGSLTHLPVIGANQDRLVVHRGWHLSTVPNALFSSSQLAQFFVRASPYQDTFAAGPATRGGDSGYPIFVIIDGEPILISLWTTKLTGTNFAGYLDEINDAITFLGGGYSLETVDLSGFPNYA